jgi:hypothetical protein
LHVSEQALPEKVRHLSLLMATIVKIFKLAVELQEGNI